MTTSKGWRSTALLLVASARTVPGAVATPVTEENPGAAFLDETVERHGA